MKLKPKKNLGLNFTTSSSSVMINLIFLVITNVWLFGCTIQGKTGFQNLQYFLVAKAMRS